VFESGGPESALIGPSAGAFVHGCNYPWSTDGTTVFYGMDFGANIWGSHLGVSTRRAAVASDFAEMARLGFTLARWFVFCDGRSGIVFDDAGRPTGLDTHFFADLDAALEIAHEVSIRLSLVLLDHNLMFRGVRDSVVDAASGVLLETSLPYGRAHVLVDADNRERLLNQVFAPVVKRYADSGARPDLAATVFAYELLNEPDFIVEEWEADLSRRVAMPIRFAALAELVADLSALVHRHSSARTTMAAARLRNLWAWDDDGLGLDFLQVHSYPDLLNPRRDDDIYGRPAVSLDCSRPVVLGEFPGHGPMQHPRRVMPPPWTLEQYLELGVQGGYAGAWPWSFSGTDGYGVLEKRILREFANKYPQLVNARART
jgi:hypothetical protein